VTAKAQQRFVEICFKTGEGMLTTSVKWDVFLSQCPMWVMSNCLPGFQGLQRGKLLFAW